MFISFILVCIIMIHNCYICIKTEETKIGTINYIENKKTLSVGKRQVG